MAARVIFLTVVFTFSCGRTGDIGGDAGGATGGGGGIARLCGGFAGLTCDSQDTCDYPDNLCGAADGQGTCVPRPGACPAFYDPTCACDGNVYGNTCEALAAGTDANVNGGCTPPPNNFSCGWRFCGKGTQYCESTVGGVQGSPGQHVCRQIPTACGNTPACSCLAVSGACQCTQSASGDITVRCFAP